MDRTLLIMCALALSANAVPGQGSGVVGSNGLEPDVSVLSPQVGVPSALVVSGLAPGSGPVFVGASLQPGNSPISGAPGAILGVSFAPSAQALVLGPFPVPSTGEITIPIVAPASVSGQTLYLQAMNLDALAPSGGIALSDARAVTFGPVADVRVASIGPPGGQSLFSVFANGQTLGPVLPGVSGMTVLPRMLAANHDTLPLRADVPVEDHSDAARPRIRLPGGRALYHYREQGGRYGFFLVFGYGAECEHLLEAAPIPGGNPFCDPIAVSRFDPVAAIVADEPLTEFGGAQLLLVRTDGTNFPGTSSPVHVYDFGGPLTGYVPDADSLTFLNGALLSSDGTRLVRVPLDLAQPAAAVVLPPSGGLAPAEIDEEIAWSEDGTTAALTAGQSDEMRDVYLVHPTGPAINLTQAPGEYEDAGYRDLVDGGRLALSPQAGRIAYVKSVAGSPEVFVQDTVPSATPWHLTGPSLFVSTIEQEAAILMASDTRMYFNAGAGIADHDTYAVVLPAGGIGPVSIQNLTATSGVLTPPFGQGAVLRGTRRGALADGVVIYELENSTTGQCTLVQLGDGPPQILATNVTAACAQPRQSGGILGLDRAGAPSQLFDAGMAGPILLTTLPTGTRIASLAGDPISGSSLAILDVGLTQSALHVDAMGQSTSFAGINALAVSPSAAFLANGTLLVTTQDAIGATVHSLDVSAGTSTPLASFGGTGLFY